MSSLAVDFLDYQGIPLYATGAIGGGVGAVIGAINSTQAVEWWIRILATLAQVWEARPWTRTSRRFYRPIHYAFAREPPAALTDLRSALVSARVPFGLQTHVVHSARRDRSASTPILARRCCRGIGTHILFVEVVLRCSTSWKNSAPHWSQWYRRSVS